MRADTEASTCKEALSEFNKLVSGLGDLIKATRVAVSGTSAAQAKQYSVDVAALSTEPCKLDIVLLPFDEDKGSPEEWQHFSGDSHPSPGVAFAAAVTPLCITWPPRLLPMGAL